MVKKRSLVKGVSSIGQWRWRVGGHTSGLNAGLFFHSLNRAQERGAATPKCEVPQQPAGIGVSPSRPSSKDQRRLVSEG